MALNKYSAFSLWLLSLIFSHKLISYGWVVYFQFPGIRHRSSVISAINTVVPRGVQCVVTPDNNNKHLRLMMSFHGFKKSHMELTDRAMWKEKLGRSHVETNQLNLPEQRKHMSASQTRCHLPSHSLLSWAVGHGSAQVFRHPKSFVAPHESLH